jgi:hypothetical protein
VSHMGKSHLVIMFTVGPEDVAEGDRIFASHGEWMKGHSRDGNEALLDYTISKGRNCRTRWIRPRSRPARPSS